MNLDYHSSLFETTLGLSCVENQFCAILVKKNYPYQVLFTKSYTPFIETITRVVNEKISYENYKGVARFHDIAEKMNLARIHSEAISDTSSFLELIKEQINKGYPTIIECNPEKLPRNYENSLPWRSDHYVAVYGYSEKDYFLLDDTPRRELVVDANILLESATGHVLTFEHLSEVDYQFHYQLGQSLVKNLITEENVDNDLFLEFFREENLGYLRDALAILRVTRLRIKAWLEWYTRFYFNSEERENCQVIDELSEKIKKIYSLVEMLRIRKRGNIDKYLNLLHEVIQIENCWIEKAKKDFSSLEERMTFYESKN